MRTFKILVILLLSSHPWKAAGQSLQADCSITKLGRSIQILEIPTTTGIDIIEVYCELNDLDEKPWLVIFIRKQAKYEYDRWQDYEQGYNTLSGNYFLGLQRLHAITSRQRYELAIHLTDYIGVQHYLHYDRFAIDGASSHFSHTLGNYVGSMPIETVAEREWLPWLVGLTELIPRMKIAMRAVS